MYVEHLADIFGALPLAEDGVLAVNIGDTYIGGKGQSGRGDSAKQAARRASGKSINAPHHQAGGGKGKTLPGDNASLMAQHNLKPKDLALIPHRFALAMQARGWYIRNDCIWAKTSAMPESVTDRLGKAHEHIFIMTRSPAAYFDRYKLPQPLVDEGRYHRRIGNIKKDSPYNTHTAHKKAAANPKLRQMDVYKRNDHCGLKDVWSFAPSNFITKHGTHLAPMPYEIPHRLIQLATREGDAVLDCFAGTGTTLAAALSLKRRALGVDLDKRLPLFLREHRRGQLGVQAAFGDGEDISPAPPPRAPDGAELPNLTAAGGG